MTLTKPQLLKLGKMFRQYEQEKASETDLERRASTNYLLHYCFIDDSKLVIMKGLNGEVLLFCEKCKQQYPYDAVQTEENLSKFVKDVEVWIERKYNAWAKDQIRLMKSLTRLEVVGGRVRKVGFSAAAGYLSTKLYCVRCSAQVQVRTQRAVKIPLCDTCKIEYDKWKDRMRYRGKKTSKSRGGGFTEPKKVLELTPIVPASHSATSGAVSKAEQRRMAQKRKNFHL